MRTWPLLLAVLAAGCSDEPRDSAGRTPTAPSSSVSAAPSPSPSQSSSPSPSPTPTRSQRPAPSPSPEAENADPRWAFFTRDRNRYGSPWFAGRHRVMIPYGCTPAPYYDPDPSCPDGQGFHHGIDIAIPCGTDLYAGRPARVLPNDALGPAYGENPVLLRVGDRDVVIGHTRRVFARVGDELTAGERFALVGDSAAPDGCHLHFEVRPSGAEHLDAVPPAGLLSLSR